jgi:hypothetical protein
MLFSLAQHSHRRIDKRNHLLASPPFEEISNLSPGERIRIPLSPVREPGPRQSTLWFLVAMSVLMIPFENEYALGGFSIAKVAILPLVFAVVLLRPRQFFSMLRQPVFLCALAFVAWGVVSEFFRPLSNWEFILRVFQTVVFAALVGAVASNVFAYRRILSSIALVCSVLAIYLLLEFYRAVNVNVGSLKEAGYLRQGALSDLGIGTGLNILAYTVGMGAVVALAQFFGSKSAKAKILWSAIYIICAVGSFVPLSRGSFLALVGASLFVVLRNRHALIKPGTLVVLIGIVVLAFSLTPRALTERYTSLGLAGQEEEAKTGKVEGRSRIFRASVANFSEYWEMGVGSGYFWQNWGPRKGFGTLGPHNGFFTAWIFYGLPGVLLLAVTCFVAARTCPKPHKTSPELAALVGLLILALFWLMFTHDLYLKSFGLILGLLMGANYRQAQLSSRHKKAVASVRSARRATWTARLKHGAGVTVKTPAVIEEFGAQRRR